MANKSGRAANHGFYVTARLNPGSNWLDVKLILKLLSTEFPLFKRELIELAQRKRTYALRCLCLAVFALVFLTMYASLTTRAVNMMWLLGQGRELTLVLFITLMFTVYALGPAMACSAITSEKEKQTLGLLLISRLNPAGIVIEKLLSRMLPLLSLVVIASPLFAICYLFGGVSLNETLAGIGILFFIVFQITAVAVFCSALLESGIAAFWMTYLTLAALYFSWPLLVGMGFLPDPDFLSFPEEEFIFFPAYQFAMLFGNDPTRQEIQWLTIPSIIVTLCFPVAAMFAVKLFSFGSAFSFARITSTVLRKPLLEDEDQETEDVDYSVPFKRQRRPRPLPKSQAIRWRERIGLANRLPIQLALISGVVVCQLMILNKQNFDDEVCILFCVVDLIVAILLVMSFACKLFTKERERQTLEVMLATPLTNHQILSEKMACINRLILVLLMLITANCILNMFCVDVHPSSLTRVFDSNDYRSRRFETEHWSYEWFVAGLVYFICALGNAFIYMHLVKWTAIFYGLRLNTQMKAMIASLVTVLVLCAVPIILGALIMISIGADPNDFPLWFFMSPAPITGINEWHDLSEVYWRSWFPKSDVIVVLFNFSVYGGLTFGLRTAVLTSLGSLLNRRDSYISGTSRWVDESQDDNRFSQALRAFET